MSISSDRLENDDVQLIPNNGYHTLQTEIEWGRMVSVHLSIWVVDEYSQFVGVWIVFSFIKIKTNLKNLPGKMQVISSDLYICFKLSW